jgi:ribonuclease E
MAESTSVAESAPVSGDDIERAEQFAREPFVLEGEERDAALAPGTVRRAALEDALAEIAGGAERPSAEWKRRWSLVLGLERVLADEEPKLVDGTVLSAHQVDALSGTLIALTAEVQATSNGKVSAAAALEELPSGEVELEGDDEIADDDEPLDWDEREEAEEEAA